MTESSVSTSSVEVIRQRVKVLSEYLQESLPAIFEGADKGEITRSSLLKILQELDEEFGTSPMTRAELGAWMLTRITYILDPIIDSKVEVEARKAVMDNPDGEDFFEGSAHVDWLGVVPDFSGDIQEVRNMAGLLVCAELNASMWDDATWEQHASGLQAILPDMADLFYGMYGFILLMVYTKVVELGVYPVVSFVRR